VAVKILAILLVLLTQQAFAFDFKAGIDAYNRGDFAAALKEWQPIADGGDAHAQYNLGMLYARGQGVPQDYPRAAEWYRKAAEQGVAAAQYNLGLMCANGQGVPRDPQEAAKWFLKAAEAGVTDAETGLGHIYNEGEGAFRNYAEAEKWYRKAAESGVASAAFSLGVMYDIGQGVPRNYDEAMKWYRKAADAGYAAAMANIGILYYNAQGVKRDLVEAYAWFDRAQKLGDPRAGELLSSTGSKLKPGDLKKAQKLAADWQPPHAPETQAASGNLFKPRPEPAAAATAPKAAVAAPSAAPIPDTWTGVERVVAVGDVHGDYEMFVKVLQSAALIDGNGDWAAGKTHLVQTGDVLDRGPDSRAVMDLLMKLEKQSAAAGGAVHCLIGNHEAMNVYGDLRYVSPGEYAAWAGSNPEPNREVTYEQYRAAFSPQGLYGKWIRSHNAAIKIDRTLYLHAGLGEKYATWTIDRINREVREELDDLTRLHGGIVTDEEGPLWYRGLAKGDDTALVDKLLKQYDVDRIVIGHTYANGAVTPRFGGKVFLIDVGISRFYDNTGKIGCLEISKGQPHSIP
jgi:TPR repeat protein